MTYKRNTNLSTFEIAEIYLSGQYQFPLLMPEPKNTSPAPTYADSRVLRKLKEGIKESLFVKPSYDFPLFASEKTHRLSQAALDALGKPGELEDEPSPDEVLRQEGFYDSTDKRCCINRAKR